MGNGKQYWKDALQAAKSEGGRQDDRIDPREQKKRSKIMYKKRKLEKDVKQYYTNARRIKSSEIERIGRQHGFHVVSTLRRED